MRVMVFVKANKESEAGVLPSTQLLTSMGKFNEELVKAGVMLAGDGLHASSKGKRVKFSGQQRTVTDGPFAETKELVGGYAIVQAKSRDEAVELGKQFMEAHVTVLGSSYEGECEIRQLFDASDCAPRG